MPAINLKIISGLHYFIVEELKSARRFLRAAGFTGDFDQLHFLVFNEHSDKTSLIPFIEPILEGNDTGLLSEAGIPCVADPGSEIVKEAHERGIRVIPLSGPSSIYLALMASGFNGQDFAFHGYLPIDKLARAKKLKELEHAVYSRDQTQLFIEAPYRNLQLFKAILESCNPGTLLCIATELTTEKELVQVKTISEWKKSIPDIHKKPTVFLVYH
ncbi:MAG: SAM-dependent methyltransferase [Bacteroidetes bacterium]|nr:SAM-dependent methyltransferase [Bacteroidota bacterium]